MEPLDCSAVYIDDRVMLERWVYRDHPDASRRSSAGSFVLSDEPDSLQSDVELLLGVCKQSMFHPPANVSDMCMLTFPVYLCHAGTSFATKLAELNDRSGTDCTPVFAFFDIEIDGGESIVTRRKPSRTSSTEISPPSPTSLRRGFTFSSQSEESYGLQLLSGVSADIQVQETPNVIIPIAVLRPSPSSPRNSRELHLPNGSVLSSEPQQVSRCLDAGAVDVLTMPLNKSRIEGLLVHAYRTRKVAQKEFTRFLARKKSRKHSWVGVHDEQPYAYLREAMVSKLMKGICNPEEVIEEFQDRELDIDPTREGLVKEQIGRWDFTAQAFSEDELVFGACEMLQHAFRMPELEQWKLTPGELRVFLLACRAAYNSFVLYHNFRHAIDVLQSVFCFLIHIGALPPYGPDVQSPVSKSPIASILSPFDALTLLISAIGHDVGHPGVNNFFLVKLNAPLAQLYNDNSVLEAFHCAAFSQILRRHWPSAFKDKQLRKLLISSILATDMGVHQKFMERLGQLQEKFYENNQTLDGWKPQDIDLYRSLICGLLIKCADISNVARPWNVAERWTKILQEEFANQGEMEKEVGMETALFGGPPELGNVYKLATGQIGFMSIFAIPLFEGVSDLMPQMQFTVDQIKSNQSKWSHLAEMEKRKQTLQADVDGGNPSPRTRSPMPTQKQGSSVPFEYHESANVVPQDDSTGDASGDKDASTDSMSETGCNENIISPVVSPDTGGPGIDITGSSHPSESGRISNGAPDAAMVSLAGALEGSSAGPGPDHGENQAPGDPAVLAAVIFSESAKNEADASANPPERPSSSRQGQGPRCNTSRNSAGRTSGPSSSQRNSCTRTQSISTYSNPMTPISPATNATSVLTIDSGDEKPQRDSFSKSEHEADCVPAPTSQPDSNSYAYPLPTENNTNTHRPFAPTSHPIENFSKSNVMTSVVGGNNSLSPANSTTTNESPKYDDYDMAHEHQQQQQARDQGRKLPKKRSRLRLAFWKRRNHHSYQTEVGET